MKSRILLFIIVSISVIILFSCKEDEDPMQVLPPVDGGAWQIFQVAKIHAPGIPVSEKTFSGSIGDIEVSLSRIDGDTLLFIIPNIGEGLSRLKVTVRNQIRTWDLDLIYDKYQIDHKTYLDAIINSSRKLQSKISEVDKLKDQSAPFGQWIEHFNTKLSLFSPDERKFLAGVLQQGDNARFYFDPNEAFQYDCYEYEGVLSSMVYKFVGFDNTYLNYYSKLPINDFNESVLAGLSLSFWYHKLLLEYYANLTLDCPLLRGFELKEAESGKVILPNETLKIESNENVSFGYNGIFKPLTTPDIHDVNGPFFLQAIGFRDKSKASKVFSDLIQKYAKTYEWDLPLLNPDSLILPPDDGPTSKGPVSGLEWNIPYFDNQNIRYIDYKIAADVINLKLESLDGNPHAFNFTFGVRTPSKSFEIVIPSLLEVTCPISLDVLLIGKTHFLDIKNGKLPYDISWSNGAKGELSQAFSPGNYDVKVIDGNGCERTVLFTVPEFGTIEDIDGNVYETFKFGNTWWMSENLRTTRKNDGSSILFIEDNKDWLNSNQASYTWYDNDPTRDETDGKLYNYPAICCNICPSGWSLPNSGDIAVLANSFGVLPARSLRAVNKWDTDLTGSTNISGLNILPSGSRSGYSGSFINEGPFQEIAVLWTNSTDDRGNPYVFFMTGTSDYFNITYSFNRNDGLSVRCVRYD